MSDSRPNLERHSEPQHRPEPDGRPHRKHPTELPGLGEMEPASPKDLLDTALSIGRRLVETACWQGQVCSWTVKVSDREEPHKRQAADAQAGPDLYQGTAGIALFLGELERVHHYEQCAETALGAIRHALEGGGEMSAAASGLHAGRTGVAYAAVRLATLLERPDLRRQALDVLRPLEGQVHLDSRLDVIGGAAGAIPALLWMAGQTGHKPLVDLAAQMGDHLIRTAHREPYGWCWRTVGEAAVRLLNGLAHGVSGCSNALLELWKAGCGERFRLAAEMGFLYERHFFDAEESNWPDLRNKEIADDLFYGRQDDLSRKVVEDRLAPFQAKYMTAWCHGSPGIGLARLRAWELTGQSVYRQEAEAALASTLRSLKDGGNFSLCHGLAGNAELPLAAARLLDRPELLQRPLEVAALGRRLHEDASRPWPCGTVNSENDPSLLLGEAGIGYFYLRLLDASLPSILLPGLGSGSESLSASLSSSDVQPQDGETVGCRELARACVDHYFSRTMAGLAALGQETRLPLPAAESDQPLDVSPSEAAHEYLCGLISETRDPERREMLKDLFLLDRTRYEMTRQLQDYTQEFLRSLVRPAAREVDFGQDRFHLLPDSKLLSTRWDWDGWLEQVSAQTNAPSATPSNASDDIAEQTGRQSPAQLPAHEPARETSYFLLYRRDNRIQALRFGVLPWVILQGLEEPSTVYQAAHQAGSRLDVQGLSPQLLFDRVAHQMESLFEAGLIDVRRSRVPEPAAG